MRQPWAGTMHRSGPCRVHGTTSLQQGLVEALTMGQSDNHLSKLPELGASESLRGHESCLCALPIPKLESEAAYYPSLITHASETLNGALQPLSSARRYRCLSGAKRPDSVDVYIQHATETRGTYVNSMYQCIPQIVYILNACLWQTSG